MLAVYRLPVSKPSHLSFIRVSTTFRIFSLEYKQFFKKNRSEIARHIIEVSSLVTSAGTSPGLMILVINQGGKNHTIKKIMLYLSLKTKQKQ